MTLTPRDAERLARICGMFGSNHDGERASAAAMADCMVRRLGLTWHQVINADPSPTVEGLVDFCLAQGHRLTAWEYGFLRGIRGKQFLTEKQLAKLHSIVAKLSARRAAAYSA
jgi:hypothetical protein